MTFENKVIIFSVIVLFIKAKPASGGTKVEWVEDLETFVSDFSPLLSQISVGAPPPAQQALSNLEGMISTVSALALTISQNTDTKPIKLVKRLTDWTLDLLDVTEVHSDSNLQLKDLGLDSDILTQMNITVSILDDVHNSMLERMIDEVALVSGEIDIVEKKKKVKKCKIIQQVINEGGTLLDDFLDMRAFLLVWKAWQIPFHFTEIGNFQTSIYRYVKCTLDLQKLCKSGTFKKFKKNLPPAANECNMALDDMIATADQLKDKVLAVNNNPGSAFVIKLEIENGPEKSFVVIEDLLNQL